MSQELAMNLYKQMVDTNDVAEATIIRNMYNSQDYKNDMLTEYFNKKCSELKINEFSKALNKNEVGIVTDCRTDVIKIEDRLLPIMTLLDNDNKSVQIGLSISALNEITKQINSAKSSLSYLKHVGY